MAQSCMHVHRWYTLDDALWMRMMIHMSASVSRSSCIVCLMGRLSDASSVLAASGTRSYYRS